MAQINRVLVVGGGIGGLCTAVGLVRAGLRVDIVELKRDWTVYGVGIIQPSNQLRALAELGLADACIERGWAFEGWEICNSAGDLLIRVPNPNVAESKYPPINGIARPVLHDILAGEALRYGISVRLGLTVDALEQTPAEVAVRFSDGSAGRYDVVIGADGTYSKIRELVFPGTPQPAFTGLAVWRYNFARPPEMTWGSAYYGRNAKAGLVPMSQSRMYMFVVTAEPGNPKMAAADLDKAMRLRLDEFTGIIGTLREQINDPGAVVYRPMEFLLLPAPWYRGRVLLIGDAAHSTTPQLNQGASIAIEDAALLAQLLPQDRPLETIFEEFMTRRLARCEYVVNTSNLFGAWEVAEFARHPDPKADPGALMGEASRILAMPY
jgi:2-polyprenyl-6-methoxyphenol hydroxylase-like FAD-dependent oxidoreductase